MSLVLLCSLLSLTRHHYLVDETRVPGETPIYDMAMILLGVRGKDVTSNSDQE